MEKYKLYCETEGTWITTDWVSTEPTECPNGSGHVINPDSIAISDLVLFSVLALFATSGSAT